jgi:hypothetical protein
VDLIDFSEPDEEIQEEIDIEYVNELPEQGESIGLEHLSNVNIDTALGPRYYIRFRFPQNIHTQQSISSYVCN